MRGNRISRFRTLEAELINYPLYPYLVYQELRRRLHKLPAAEVRQFLTAYADTPLARRLRNAWLKQLFKRRRWSQFLDSYVATTNTRLQCKQLAALLRSGKAEQALAAVADIWLVGKSQPKDCDPVFTAWRKNGNLTAELAWRRVSLDIARTSKP